MANKNEIDDPRREFLVKALAAGLFAAGGSAGVVRPTHAMAKVSRELPPGKSIYEIVGESYVDGKKASLDTTIGANSTLRTGPDGRLIFAVGKDAFVLRSNSKLKLSGTNTLVDTLNLISGKLLSVFGKSTHTANTLVATIGIRGTGMYLETYPEKTYVCTCYGIVDINANNDPQSKQTVKTKYHDAPRYILANAAPGESIVAAPVINHTDVELALLEELVGRVPPFGKRSEYY